MGSVLWEGGFWEGPLWEGVGVEIGVRIDDVTTLGGILVGVLVCVAVSLLG